MAAPFGQLHQTNRTVAAAYEGVTANSYQSSCLNSCGMFIEQSNFADAAHGGVHTIMSPLAVQTTSEEGLFARSERKPSASNKIARNAMNNTPVNESTLSSESEIYPSSGVPLDESDMNVSGMDQGQMKTFQQLAEEKGIREWNNTVLDERWLESFDQNTTTRNERYHLTGYDNLTAKGSELASLRHPRLQSFLKELDDTRNKMDSKSEPYKPDPSIWGFENTYPQHAEVLRGQQSIRE